MKILLVSHTFEPELNGVSRVVSMLAESLVSRGCEVTVATQFNATRKSLIWKGVKIEQFKISGNAISGIKGEVARYESFIQNGNWDIQHHHACQIWGFDALLDWFSYKNRKIIVTPHGFSQLHNPDWKNYFSSFKKVNTHIDAFTCLSENAKEKTFLENAGVENIKVIQNGIDLEEFGINEANRLQIGDSVCPDYKSGQADKFQILNVSNHVSTKGHKILYELAQKFPEIMVSNVGKPVNIEKWNLGKLGLKLPCYYECKLQSVMTPNFHTLNLSRLELISAYQQADIFVMPSDIEAAPLVILEAMAAGLPWVSFDVGNVKELAGGLVVKNKSELFEAVLYLKDNPEICQKLGFEGQDFVRKYHDWKNISEKYWELYIVIDC